MPKPLTTSFAQAYAAVGNDLLTRLGDAQAALAGPPIGDPVEPATDEDRVKAWNARDPKATDEAMLQLAQQKYQEHIAAGMTPDTAQKATAEDLTHFRYGQRLKLYTYGQVGFAEQVKEAARIARLAARDSTPNPPLPPPGQETGVLTNMATLDLTPEDLRAPPVPPLSAPTAPALPASAATMPPIPNAAVPGAVPGAPPAAPPRGAPAPPTPGGY